VPEVADVKCPICGDVFRMYTAPGGLDEPWYFTVFHDHAPSAQDPGVWTGMVYQHYPRQRYPEGRKELMERMAASKKLGRENKGVVERGKETCPLHPEGCEHEASTDV
jgi:hypothetical protein